MNDLAYDISHLLESEPFKTSVPEFRTARVAYVAPPVQSVAAAQEALAKELLQAAAAHEALIQQYLRMTDVAYQDSYGQ
ncbi:hypothetical protein EAH88_02035 [Rhodanobacter glycinis]|uniref:Uncharacterized protein n=1 Tax=Rhodanobacter glycinis TaxID=582702 RepID=A0A502CF70_9GAMM|nr:hypothetical protein [Rhodanobacter glycinis]TPG11342.1 hypothetical protein EAH88_02035 [Rhodanobacter glycinis]